MKKLIALVLALVLVFSFSVAASAVQNITNDVKMENGSITIAGATENYNYALYKLLHLETYDNDNGAYTYKVEDNWATFFATAEALTYVSIDESGYVSWNDGADVVAFGKAALKYAQDNNIAPEADADPTTEIDSTNFKFNEGGGGVFSKLTLGYYLVDTSMGALCGLSTAKPDGHISAKNGIPTVEKQVQEDSHVGTTTAEYGPSNTADIGQKVNFDITINAQPGAQNYIYHDMMTEGLELDPDTDVIVLHHSGADTVTLTEGEEYTFVTNPTEAKVEDWTCSFEVVFDQEFLDTVKANDKLYIRYTAILNDDAVIGGEGNINKATLTYGDGHQSNVASTTTYTFGFDIYKTDADMKPLQGAEFKLLDVDGNEIQLAYNSVEDIYRRATRLVENEEWCNNTIVVKNADGVARVVGLDNGTYYLQETKAPDGFKILTTNKEFIISGNNLYVEKTADGSVTIGASVHVENNKGITLPETGGLGVVLFTVLGGGTALGTGAVLVTKKRMSKIEDED